MKKKILSILLVLSMMVGMLSVMPISISAAELAGAGTEGDPYKIGSVDDWNYFANNISDYSESYVEVTASELDFGGSSPKKIKNFKGTLDGNGVVIKNVNMSGNDDIGLICTSSGTYKNFVITKSSFSVTNQWVGSLICCTNDNTIVENVFVSSTVSVTSTKAGGNAYAGGILGGFGSKNKEYKVTFSDCVFAGTVNAPGNSKNCGGIFGGMQKGDNGGVHSTEIKNCMVTGALYGGRSPSSGFIGFAEDCSVSFENCIYAGGAEEDYFWSFPFSQKLREISVINCYTTYVCNGGGVYKDGSNVTVKYNSENSGVTWVNEDEPLASNGRYFADPDFDSRAALKGLDAKFTVEGFTKREDDIMIPNGVANFANTGIFGKCTVQWVDGYGNVIETDVCEFGSTPSFDGADPYKYDDDQFTYTFSGWTPEATEVTGDITYVAKFDRELKSYIPGEPWDTWDGTSDDDYTEWGDGTEYNPYIIRTAEQWANLAKRSGDLKDGKFFELAASLDFNDIEGLTPISPDGKKCLIYFDGNGHTITGVNMTWTEKDGAGLFGDIWGSIKSGSESRSVIKNFVITESVFNGQDYTGALIGEVSGPVLVQNIYVDRTVTINSIAGSNGGIIGGCYYDSKDFDANGVAEITVTIEDCVFAGQIIAGNTKNGGILGDGNSKDNEIFHIVINNCLVTGVVAPNVGHSSGFVGYNEHTLEIKEGEGENAVVKATYKASLTLNNCIYAGGGEKSYYGGYTFGRSSNTIATNCYTTHTNNSGNVYVSGTGVKYYAEGSGVTLIEVEKLLGLNATAPEGWTTRAGDIPVPNGVADFALVTFTQKLFDGASVRMDTSENNTTGLRFKAILGEAFLESFGYGNVTFGIIIAPTDYIAEAGDVFTVDALNALGHDTNYILGQADKLMDGGDGEDYYVFSAVLTNVKKYNYTREFSARAYIAVDGVIVYYSNYDSTANSRSIADVAEKAYNDTSATKSDAYKYEIAPNAGVYSPYGAAQRALLPAFFNKVATNIYLMSYNIRNIEGGDSLWNDPLTYEKDGRDQAVVDYILSEMPDVLGLQEVSVKTHAHNSSSTLSWFDTLVQLEAKGYALYKGENILPADDNKEMYNPIYYKADKYDLVGSGFGYLSDDGEKKAYDGEYRGVAYVVLQDKTTGEKFVYVNVHMTRKPSDKEIADGAHNYQEDVAGYLMNFVEGLKSEYTCPIFIGGDFNGSYSDYKKYCLDGENNPYWGSTAIIARDKATNKSAGCSTVWKEFTEIYTSSGTIDLYYMLNRTNITVHNFAVTDNKVESTGLYPSDHLPVKLVVSILNDKTN